MTRPLVLLAILFTVSAIAAVPLTTLSWQKFTPSGAGPAVRREAMAAYDSQRNQMILFGGRNVDKYDRTIEVFADTWVLDLNSMTWRELSLSTAPPATYAGVAGIAGQYFVVATGGLGSGGGNESDSSFTSDVWVISLTDTLDNATDAKWYNLTTQGTTTPQARFGAVGGTVGTDLYLSHGGSLETYADSWRLDLKGLTKGELGNNSASVNYTWYLYGGGCSEYSYDHPHPRVSAAGTVTPTRNLVMYGGCLSSRGHAGPCPSRDAWVYTLQLNKWRWGADGPPQSMYGGMANIKDNEVLHWGGEYVSNQISITEIPDPTMVHVLNPATNHWRRYITSDGDSSDSTANVPGIRAGPVFITINATANMALLMWGGSGIDNQTDDSIYMLTGSLLVSTELELGWFWWTLWHIHGILMFVAWGVIFQISACVSRYCKQTGGDYWLYAHVTLNIIGIIVSVAGFAMGFASASTVKLEAFWAHSLVGIAVLALMAIQPCVGICRPGKGNKNVRLCWSWTHWGIGWMLLAMTFANIFLGLLVALLNRIAWAFLAYAAVIFIMHVILSLLGFNKPEAEGQSAYTPMDEGHFKVSDAFTQATKGGSSALYK